MVFGGYDASLNGSSSVSFNFAENAGRELVVAVQSITKIVDDTRTDLLPNGILAVLDSSQPNIWLPVEACRRFEEAFGISWNETSEMYMLNSTLHDSLVAENANITFQLGNTLSGGSTVDIVFPYSAFDLTASWPLASESQPYFPLKRAANDTQYTLGRAFMQEAYLIADYEENKFELSQRRWDDSAEQNLVPIRPPSSNNETTSSTEQSESSSNSSLSVGAIVGIVVGAVAVSVVLTIAIYKQYRRRYRRDNAGEGAEKPSELDIQSSAKGGAAVQGAELATDGAEVSELEPAKMYGAELQGDQEHCVEIDGLQKVAEADSSQTIAEMDGLQAVAELDGVQRLAEMDGEGRRPEVHELPGNTAHPSVEGR
ncbi:hypothetical protein DIS24_g5898 [Lasiodiplodia hormozganensis]|uniref:Peptidase A1 domain-containing protein n=1 Tax=Lasiodiplodia hormozganensis TaxID=869390 RepID=A0AA39YL89_9PEZI|nr:hypothetical protein DIS24_g5898 [Lasiodiplodia hormozganensis]